MLDLAEFRATYRDPAELDQPAAIVRLAAGDQRSGDRRPSLVCCCTMSPLSGPHEYARLAAAFDGTRDVYALPHRGFAEGEALPADADVAMRTHVDTVLRTVGDEPFTLAGHSAARSWPIPWPGICGRRAAPPSRGAAGPVPAGERGHGHLVPTCWTG